MNGRASRGEQAAGQAVGPVAGLAAR